MSKREQSSKRGQRTTKLLVGTALAGLVLVALIAGFNTAGPQPDSQNLGPNNGVAHNSDLFRNMGYDLDWKPGLNNDIRSFLTLTGAGTVRQADQVDNNPEHALNEAGMRPLVSTAEGTALWSNCSSIKVSVYFSETLNDLAAARKATSTAVSQLGKLTGLNLSTPRNLVTDEVPAARPGEIRLVWVAEGSVHLADGILGEAHVRFNKSQLKLRSAVVVLSDRIITEVEDSQHWAGDTAALSVLHELGHAVGLGHSLDSHSVMAPSLADEADLTLADRSAFAYAGTRHC